jgi:Sel1 repeat
MRAIVMTFLLQMIRAFTALALVVCGSVAYASAHEAWRAYLAKDYAKAVELARAPAESGDKDAQYLLGLAAKHGRGAAQDHEAAVRWFTLAAERGHGDALNDLATCFSRGEGVARDDAKAFEYFRMAAERGSAAGQQNVARMYEQGVGTSKDPIKARFWYERADARIYGRELRRVQAAKAAPVQPVKSLPESCRPPSPPIEAMRRAKVDSVAGTIDAYVDGKGNVRGVSASNLTNDELRYDVVAVFSQALRAAECKFAEGFTEASIQIPFKLELVP